MLAVGEGTNVGETEKEKISTTLGNRRESCKHSECLLLLPGEAHSVQEVICTYKHSMLHY